MDAGRLRRWYTRVAVFALNTALVLVAVNLVALALAPAPPLPASPARPTFSHRTALERAYPDLSREAIDTLIDESARGVIYEPFTQFRERPHAGTYVNVDPNGFRRSTGQGPWPPERSAFNVFVFGGSTTFNYGVRDDDTIASHLYRLLATAGLPRPPRVYNFGRGAYYSSQELALFGRLLTAGAAPDVAIFIDGLNDFFFHDDQPALTPLLARLVDGQEQQGEPGVLALLARLPAVDLVMRRWPARATMLGTPPPVGDDLPAVSERVIARYVANTRLIEAMAAGSGAVPLFVWQPIPTYRYDLSYHVQRDDFGGHERSRFGYPRMADYVQAHPLGARFLWCADIQAKRREPLYVDQVHYSPHMSQLVASCIFTGAGERGVWNARRPPVIACIGDSITWGLTGSAVGGRPLVHDPEGGYPGRLQRLLGSRARVLNRGVGGSTAAQWLLAPQDPAAAPFRTLVEKGTVPDFPRAALASSTPTALEAILAADRPDIVVLLLGANDLALAHGAAPEEAARLVAERLERLAEIAAQQGYRVLVSTVLPNTRDSPAALAALNDRIRARWPDFLPLAERLAEAGGTLLSDEIHLTEDGYALVARTLADELTRRGLLDGRATQSSESPSGSRRRRTSHASIR